MLKLSRDCGKLVIIMRCFWGSLTIVTPLLEIKDFKRRRGRWGFIRERTLLQSGQWIQVPMFHVSYPSLCLSVLICEMRTLACFNPLAPSNTLEFWAWLVPRVGWCMVISWCGVLVCLVCGVKESWRDNGRSWRPDVVGSFFTLDLFGL